MNRSITKVALAAAAALTLSLASPVSAQANETTAIAPSTAGTTSLPTASTRTASNALTTFAVRDGVIGQRGNNPVLGTFVPGVSGSNFHADVFVNGRGKGRVELHNGGFYYPGTWGAGKVRLGPVRYTDGTNVAQVAAQYSNYFTVRQGVKWNKSPMSKRGSKVTFKLRGFKTFNGTRWVSVKKVKLQVKKGKKWKNIKTVKVNKSGSKKFSIKSKKKRTYRVTIPTTARIKGASTGGKRI
ncbi:hypothetical protein [Aeromicrobium duanguangcaii]|uniref:hypothetical protein n=1 Tax=Aeromicrobium duanguangcaii TaxID=2968086 RepID=UPI00201800F0|nr:hypothetical protein [Aeromicrobium duanguangcaii]MCL3838470.1 hypothetical protein [Aeromicrobium duanguangcaii]